MKSCNFSFNFFSLFLCAVVFFVFRGDPLLCCGSEWPRAQQSNFYAIKFISRFLRENTAQKQKKKFIFCAFFMYIDWVELKSTDDDDEIEVFQKQQQQRCSWNFTVKRMSPTNREWSAYSSDERESQHSNQTAQNINFIFRSPRVDVVVVVSARCSTEFKSKPVDLICTRRREKSCIELSRGADCSRWHFPPLSCLPRIIRCRRRRQEWITMTWNSEEKWAEREKSFEIQIRAEG